MKWLRVFFLAISCFTAARLAAAANVSDTTSSTNTNELRQLLSSMKTFRSDFKERVLARDGTLQGRFVGVLAIKKPGKFYWRIEQPNQQIIVVNEQQITVYDVDLEQASIDRFSEENKDAPINFLTYSPERLFETFNVKQIRPHQFQLQPKKPSGIYRSITLSFNKKGALTQLFFIDGLQQRVELELIRPQLNPAIADRFFKLTLPKTVDILKSTERHSTKQRGSEYA